MREMLIVILNGCEGSIPVVRQAVSCHQSHRFFTPRHCPVFCFFHTAFLRPFRMTIGGKGVIMREMLSVILNECEGSITVVKKPVRRYQSNRFFTPCHCPVFCFFHTAFLRPFRMTIGGKGVIMREMLSVILNECEGSITVVRKTVRR